MLSQSKKNMECFTVRICPYKHTKNEFVYTRFQVERSCRTSEFSTQCPKRSGGTLRLEARRIPARRIPGRPGSQNEVRAKAAQPRSRSFIGWVRARALTCRSARARILRTCTFARPRARDTALCTSPRASPIRERLDQLHRRDANFMPHT